MVVYIYSTQPEILVFLKNRLEKKNHQCVLYTSKITLTRAILKSDFLPDLFLCDFEYENQLGFSMVDYINNMNLYLPTVYYNDPTLGNEKAYNWKYMIKTFYFEEFDKRPDRIKAKDEEFEEVLKITEDFVLSPKFKPYLKFMQEPLPFPKELTLDYYDCEEENIPESKTSLFAFKRKSNLPENLFILLQIFYEQKEQNILIRQICDLYCERKKFITEKSLTVLISQLRRYFKEYPEFKFYIQHNNDSYIFFTK